MGPIDLIRKNSRKLRRKLSKHDSSVLDHVETIPDVTSFPKNTKNSNKHSLSFDLSSIDRYDYYDIPQPTNNSHSLYMNKLGFHSVQNLSTYTKKNSVDHLGDLIEIPKNRSTSPTKRDRKSFDFSVYQHTNNTASRRISSDSTLHSNSKKRPTSLIIDNRKAKFYIPNNHMHYDDTALLYKNSSILKSTASLDNLLLNDHGTLKLNGSNKNNKTLLKNTHSKMNDKSCIHNQKQRQEYINNHHQKYSQHKSSNNNHGVVKKNGEDINSFTSFTKINLFFAIIYHVFNVLFSFFVYLPIFIIFKMGKLITISVLIFGFMWYTDNWPTLNINKLNESSNTILKIQT